MYRASVSLDTVGARITDGVSLDEDESDKVDTRRSQDKDQSI